MTDNTNIDVTALLEYWQRVLFLQDWDIKVYIKRHYDMNATDMGSCTFRLTKKTAIILILDVMDYDPHHTFQQDQECTLVHELIHLHLAYAPSENNQLMLTMEEQAVHALSRALVNLKRAGVQPIVSKEPLPITAPITAPITVPKLGKSRRNTR